jgi:hypothetical protein
VQEASALFAIPSGTELGGYSGRSLDALLSARFQAPRYLATHPAARPALALYRSRGRRSTLLITRPGIGPRLVMHRVGAPVVTGADAQRPAGRQADPGA